MKLQDSLKILSDCVQPKSLQSCPTLQPHGLLLTGSSVHGISQARILQFHFLLQGIFLTQGSNLHNSGTESPDHSQVLSGPEGALGQTGESPAPKLIISPSHPCAVTLSVPRPRRGCDWRREPWASGSPRPSESHTPSRSCTAHLRLQDCHVMLCVPHKVRCRCIEHAFGLYERRRGWDDMREQHHNMYIIKCETDRQSRLDA